MAKASQGKLGIILGERAGSHLNYAQIVVPGFSEKVFELVWNTSSWITFELFKSEGWSELEPGQGMDVLNIPELTLRVSIELFYCSHC